MLKNKQQAFTLLEALLALAVLGLVFGTIQIILPCFRKNEQLPLDVSLRAMTYQISAQKYELIAVSAHELQLKSHDGKKMTLGIVRHRLQLSGEGAGQIILISEVKDFNVQDCKAYLQLALLGQNSQRATETLYLPRTTKTD